MDAIPFDAPAAATQTMYRNYTPAHKAHQMIHAQLNAITKWFGK